MTTNISTQKSYQDFIRDKKHLIGDFGFDPIWYPKEIFDFQKEIVSRAVRKGRMAIFADTGLGKTRIQLSIANNIVLKTNKKVLILTPLAVAFQFIQEANDIEIDDIEHCKDGNHSKKIVVCNYERLHYFDSEDFECVICDESSILKNFDGKIKSHITAFVKKIKYRFLSTATPAPNDYIEFGTSSEALGYLGYMDMLSRFFSNKENNFKPHDIGTKFYLKPHAKPNFFNWLNQWSITVKMPSDLGYSDDGYILPELIKNYHYVKNQNNWVINGQFMMFNRMAKTLSEVRQEQKGTIQERCELAVKLANDKTSVYWCNFNNEGDLIQSLDPGSVQVKGGMSLDKKEEVLLAFANGDIKRLITKPKISSMGLNWQHCNHSCFFPTFSYEQSYQAFRRFWRFGQTKDVTIEMILSDGQKRVKDALHQKEVKANEFQDLIRKDLKSSKEKESKIFNQEIIKPTFL